VELRLIPSAAPELVALAGSAGVMSAVMVDYGGFEPVQRLVAAVVIDGTPIDPSLAAKILRLQATEGPAHEVSFEPQALDDAIEEAIFVDQRDIEEGEQKHFEQAIGQLERFVEDKILVCRRERVSIAEKHRSALARRDEIVGSSARDRIEAEITQLSVRDEILEHRIRALESREDEVYRKWREKYHELRYQPPTVKRLFQVTFEIAPTQGLSC